MVSLYVFGHLLKNCRADGILRQPTQVGIEVAVPQLENGAEHPKRKKVVRKDVVIWNNPNMTAWSPDGLIGRQPIAVMEWKVIHRFNQRSRGATIRGHAADKKWLKEKSRLLPYFIGYAVLVERTGARNQLVCARVWRGEIEEDWLVCPIKAQAAGA